MSKMSVGTAINKFLPPDETWEGAEAGMLRYVHEVLIPAEGGRLTHYSTYHDSWFRGGKEVRRLNALVELAYGDEDAKVSEQAEGG